MIAFLVGFAVLLILGMVISDRLKKKVEQERLVKEREEQHQASVFVPVTLPDTLPINPKTIRRRRKQRRNRRKRK